MQNNLYTIPQSWVWTTVGELYDIVGGGTPSTMIAEYWQGRIPWITSADIHDLTDIRPRKQITEKAIKDSATNLVPSGSIIVVTRVGLGKVALTKASICFSQDSQALVGNKLLSSVYSLYFLSKAVGVFRYEHRGTTIAGVTKKQLSELSFALPPFKEQHRIVAKTEELFTKLDAGVKALKKVKVLLKRYRQSVLKSAFEGKLTAEWREAHKRQLEPASVLLERIKDKRKKALEKKYKELPSLDTASLPELPEGWCWTYLPNLGNLNRGKSKHRPRDDDKLFGGEYPFVQTGDIRNSNGFITTYSQTYNECGLKQSKLWQPGTLCITIAANISETSILAIAACFPDSVVGFEADNRLCNVKYMHYFFKTIKSDLESFAPATAQKNINLDTLRNIIVPLPFPGEQNRIVEEIDRHFSVADEVEKVVEQSMKQAGRLRQSILKTAFQGKLVPQDPNDEPAEKLLEQIREEKVKQEGKRGRKTNNKVKNLTRG